LTNGPISRKDQAGRSGKKDVQNFSGRAFVGRGKGVSTRKAEKGAALMKKKRNR